MQKKYLAYIAIAMLLILVAVFMFVNYINRERTTTFSIRNTLSATWKNYTHLYVDPVSNRVIDRDRNDTTTSEGISYTLLRAVWLDDKITFDKTLVWAQENLMREDKLYSWLYGTRTDGTLGVIEDQGGDNTASDADTNIALALIFAGNRWNDSYYITEAKGLLASIWKEEVVSVQGIRYLAANNIEKSSKEKIIVNPSYLQPYAYRIFSLVDKRYPWIQLVDSSYDILERSTSESDENGKVGRLPPDWITIDRKTGELIWNTNVNLSHNYSYDALRVPWNIALDYEWSKDERALIYIKTLSVLGDTWKKNGKLASVYSHSGEILDGNEVPAMYGGSIGYFMLTDKKTAEKFYAEKLISRFNEDSNSWKTELSYYDDNWAWFGIALYNHLLPDLSINPNSP